MTGTKKVPLLGGGQGDAAPPLEDRRWWRFTHALGFCTGGVFFALGTTLYYLAMGADAAEVARLGDLTARLYIVGSLGFLYVDVQEFLTFTDSAALRLNIACSMLGSTLYVIGSAGFLSTIYAMTPLIGILGFIGGSAAIGLSQTWKLWRILAAPVEPGGNPAHRTTAAFVEGGAMVGGYGFLVGTFIFWYLPVAGDPGCEVTCRSYNAVLLLWEIGSLAFTFGGLSLVWRHAVMKIT